MLKFIEQDTQVVLREIPDEISLTINLTNCPHKCPGCHSPYLRDNIGEELSLNKLGELIKKNEGVSCVCFFGGDGNKEELGFYFDFIRSLGLKVAWYSGDTDMCLKLSEKCDYVKVGPYVKELGPLDKETTNQRLYKVERNDDCVRYTDITYKFWKKW